MKLTVESDPNKIVNRIKELEADLKSSIDNRESFDSRNLIKNELRQLYRLRKKQKNYTKPPKKFSTKGF